MYNASYNKHCLKAVNIPKTLLGKPRATVERNKLSKIPRNSAWVNHQLRYTSYKCKAFHNALL